MKQSSLTAPSSKQASSVSQWCCLKQDKSTYLRVNCHRGRGGRTGYSGGCCCIMQDGWITGDLSTLQFWAPPWVHVTGWTNTLWISFLCLFHPDIQSGYTLLPELTHCKMGMGSRDSGKIKTAPCWSLLYLKMISLLRKKNKASATSVS